MLVQVLIAQPSVVALDSGVPVRYAGLDQPQLEPMPMRPLQHRLARELRAGVRLEPRVLSLERLQPPHVRHVHPAGTR